MNAIAIIPARIGSTRFPAKALHPINGIPMVAMVYQAVAATRLFDDVIVATDDAAIIDCVHAHGGKALLTSPDHRSGSDRAAELASSLDARIIVNVQGDEPFIDRTALAALLDAFNDPDIRMASLMTRCTDPHLISDPNVVKVVCDACGNALYFSRSPIPFDRDATGCEARFRHIGVYAFTRETLLRFVALPQSPLEMTEKLEQLRALENGIPIRMVQTEYQGIGIDTPEDLIRVEAILNAK